MRQHEQVKETTKEHMETFGGDNLGCDDGFHWCEYIQFIIYYN